MNFGEISKAPWFSWLKVTTLLLGILTLSFLVPNRAVDPWGLLNLRKFFQVIEALLLIQVLGVLSVRLLGRRHGLLLMGFLGGIISSTALTVSLARQNGSSSHKAPAELLPFLAATLAMLVQAFLLAFLGISQFPWEMSLLFIGPIFFTIIVIALMMRKHPSFPLSVENEHLIDLRGTLGLVLFIMAILAVSKLVQNLAGQTGLQFLTFVVSLFEIHGSVISNTQLYESGGLDSSSLADLLTISIVASYTSKIFLVFALGGAHFKKYVALTTFGSLCFVMLSWFLFHTLT